MKCKNCGAGVEKDSSICTNCGAVVNKDIPDNATAVGVPAKVINFNNPAKFIGHKWPIPEM